MTPHQIIIRPLITEKNTNLMSLNKYSFEVDRNANKTQIKHAIEFHFQRVGEKSSHDERAW